MLTDAASDRPGFSPVDLRLARSMGITYAAGREAMTIMGSLSYRISLDEEYNPDPYYKSRSLTGSYALGGIS